MNPDPSNSAGPTEVWKVHIAGPDDIHSFADELEALRFANSVNLTYVADRLKHPNPEDEVLCVATVEKVSP